MSPVRKRWYNTQTGPKPDNSQKKILQYSNRAKTCHQSEKDGTILKQIQNLSPVRKRWYKTQTKQKNMSAVRKRLYNSQTGPKPANSQKKMVQYSIRAKTCHQSEKCSTILKQSQNLSPVRKRWFNTQTEPRVATSQKKTVQWSNKATCQQLEKRNEEPNVPQVKEHSKKLSSYQTLSPVKKETVQYLDIGKTCHNSKKDSTILKQCQNLKTVRK